MIFITERMDDADRWKEIQFQAEFDPFRMTPKSEKKKKSHEGGRKQIGPLMAKRRPIQDSRDYFAFGV